MIEPSKDAAHRQRRANWVGLRTLRQRPKLVGATDDGEPIYEVRAVRLVLLGTSPHLNRLAPCSRCGRELPGAPVMTPADLDIELRPMICADCIRGTGITSVWDPEAARRAARGQDAEAQGGTDLGPSAPSAPVVQQEPPSLVPDTAPGPVMATAPEAASAAGARADVDAGIAAGDRLAAMERHLGAVTARVNELGRRGAAQQAQSEERRRREADAAAARDAAVDRALAELRADLASSLTANRASDAELLEERLNQRLADIRAEVASSVAEVHVPDVHALEDRLNEGMEGLAELVAAQRTELAAVVAQLHALGSDVRRLSQAADELAGAQDRLERHVTEAPGPAAPAAPAVDPEAMLEELLARQRTDLAAAVEASVAARTAGLVGADEELAGEQTALDRRLGALAGQVKRVMHRLEALSAWTEPAGERIEALEKAIQQALRSRPVRHVAPPRNGAGEVATPAPVTPSAAPSGSILETLERQLEAAAGRLAARSDADPEH